MWSEITRSQTQMVTKINIVYSDLRHSVLAIAARSIYPTMATAYIIITMPNTHWPCRVALCVQRFARWKNGWFFFFLERKSYKKLNANLLFASKWGTSKTTTKIASFKKKLYGRMKFDLEVINWLLVVDVQSNRKKMNSEDIVDWVGICWRDRNRFFFFLIFNI